MTDEQQPDPAKRYQHMQAVALRILHTLRDAGFDAYFCGGCVRDRLMGVTPKDIDIATSAVPDQIEQLFTHTVAVGKAFGVMVVVEDDCSVEVATFRTETGYADGRRPDQIAFSTPQEDVQRRDFTINAMLYDPVTDTVLDYVGGRHDLEHKILRTVGDPTRRFTEDKLRLLRAVRFAARTGFTLDEQTENAMTELAQTVTTVSGERIGEELRRMLTEGAAYPAMELLRRTGLLAAVLPEVAAMHGVEQPEEFHPEGDVWQHTLLMIRMMDDGGGDWSPATAQDKEILGFAVLLHDVGKPGTFTVSDRIRFNGHDALGRRMAEDILRRLKRPKIVIETVCDMIGRHMHFASLPRMREAKRRRFLQEPEFALHLSLHRLDCLASHSILSTYDYGLAKWREEQEREPPPPRLLTGADLIRLGFAPGPAMGKVLRALDDAQLEGAVLTRQQAEDFVAHWQEQTDEPDSESELL